MATLRLVSCHDQVCLGHLIIFFFSRTDQKTIAVKGKNYWSKEATSHEIFFLLKIFNLLINKVRKSAVLSSIITSLNSKAILRFKNGLVNQR
jgi:hypothetical protein